jgi:hypothetical protein
MFEVGGDMCTIEVRVKRYLAVIEYTTRMMRKRLRYALAMSCTCVDCLFSPLMSSFTSDDDDLHFASSLWVPQARW